MSASCRWLASVTLVLALAGCKAGAGDPCKEDNDCNGSLTCCTGISSPGATPRGTCMQTCTGIRMDAGVRDASIEDAARADAATDGATDATRDAAGGDGGPPDGGPSDGGPSDGGPDAASDGGDAGASDAAIDAAADAATDV